VVDENLKFAPGTRYMYATAEERASLEFPDGWDLSELDKLSGKQEPGRPAYDQEDVNRVYGEV